MTSAGSDMLRAFTHIASGAAVVRLRGGPDTTATEMTASVMRSQHDGITSFLDPLATEKEGLS